MEKAWTIREKPDSEIVRQLMEALKIDETLAALLVMRNITDFEAAKTFFRPQLAALHDPFRMTDMEKAVERVHLALENNEKILVYGDYDVDGTTSVALVYLFLKHRTANVGYYVPDRFIEGYGISFLGIDYAEKNGYSLIIALDCGIKAIDKVEYARAKNIDFIICDHHTAGDTIPAAVAVLDPKRPDCNYPFKELSGCGVGFKLLHAYALKYEPASCSNDDFMSDELQDSLDLVCVSIASDIVPIVGENRILAHYGLQHFNSNPRIGLKAIRKVAGIENKEADISDLVFKIGPRINAAGRIEKGLTAVEVLIAETEEGAFEHSKMIDDFNILRKNMDSEITEEACRMIEANKEFCEAKSTVLFNSQWSKGIIGIVASRLIEHHYYRPTIMLTEADGKASGSARSVDGFNLYEAIDACSDLLISFGGHRYAAGLTMRLEDVDNFREKFDLIVSKTIKPEQLIPRIEVDNVISFIDINRRFFNILRQFAPFGPENMAPVFVTRRVKDYGGSRPVGIKSEHLKLEMIHDNIIISGIAFNMSDKYSQIKNNYFDICYTIEQNEFNGRNSIQLMVRDIKVVV